MTDEPKKKRLNVTPVNAIKAKCYVCSGEYADGRKDCKNSNCPLYKWSPYGKLDPGIEWIDWPVIRQRKQTSPRTIPERSK
jgi:hypothetical protein